MIHFYNYCAFWFEVCNIIYRVKIDSLSKALLLKNGATIENLSYFLLVYNSTSSTIINIFMYNVIKINYKL